MASSMTVKELAEALLALPKEVHDWEVNTEGCDCYGVAGHLYIDTDMKEVSIMRAIPQEQIPYEYKPSQEEVELRDKGLLP